MRLIIGTIVFLLWGTASTFWYVCKVKGLCLDGAKVPGLEQLVDEQVADSELEPDIRSLDSSSSVKEEKAASEPLPPQLEENYTVLFAFAKPIISNPQATDQYITDVISYLQSNPGSKVQITGFTDDTAARQNNLKLGQRRAEAIGEMFENQGLPATQILLDSQGESNPVATNDTQAGRKKNRRVEIQLITD